MKRFIILGMLLCCLSNLPAQAQETGPLMMKVEFGYTLFGMLGGAGAGFVVWLTDPGGPTAISENIKSGAILGAVVGAIAGYFILYNAVIRPGEFPAQDNLNDLLNQQRRQEDIFAERLRLESSLVAFSQQRPLENKNLTIHIPLMNYKF